MPKQSPSSFASRSEQPASRRMIVSSTDTSIEFPTLRVRSHDAPIPGARTAMRVSVTIEEIAFPAIRLRKTEG